MMNNRPVQTTFNVVSRKSEYEFRVKFSFSKLLYKEARSCLLIESPAENVTNGVWPFFFSIFDNSSVSASSKLNEADSSGAGWIRYNRVLHLSVFPGLIVISITLTWLSLANVSLTNSECLRILFKVQPSASVSPIFQGIDAVSASKFGVRIKRRIKIVVRNLFLFKSNYPLWKDVCTIDLFHFR